MLNKRFILSSIAFLISGITYAADADISTFPPGSALFEAVRENLIQNGNTDVTDEQVIQQINASTDRAFINKELTEYFSDRIQQSALDNSRAGFPILKIYVKNLSAEDIKYVYSNKKYEMVQLESNRFSKIESDIINSEIGETLVKEERLAKLLRSGYYEPQTETFIVKIATDKTTPFEKSLKLITEKYKIRIKYVKDESDMIDLLADPVNSPAKKKGNDHSGNLKLGGVEVTGGLPISKSSGPDCTIGFSSINPDGSNGFITAGHCINTGDNVRLFAQSSLSYVPIGVTGFSSNGWGNGNDYARVNNQPGATYRPYVTRYGNTDQFNTYYNHAWGPYTKPIRTTMPSLLNNPICKTGFPSGETCGTITNTSTWFAVPSNYGVPYMVVTNIVETNACAIQGDSGGPAYNLGQSAALGVIIAGKSAGGDVCTNKAVVGGSNKSVYVPIATVLSKLNVNLLLHTGPATFSEDCNAPVCMK